MNPRATRLDWWLPLCALSLALIGIVAIYSANQFDNGDEWRKQIVWLVLGTCVGTGLVFTDYRLLVRFSRPFYIVCLFLLFAVLVRGEDSSGAQRWIDLGPFRFQPSEIAKLAVILVLSAHCATHRPSLLTLQGLCKSFLVVIPPLALILKQPDLGTSLVLVVVWFGIVWVAGARVLHLGICCLAGILIFAGMWHSGRIREYQKKRLTSFLDPSADPRRSGWHTIQSTIAIGSGGLTGKGLLRGSQSQGGFIPEQHTDFIHSVIGEELGFVGSCVVLLLFFILLSRGLAIARECDDRTGRLIAAGIVAMLAFHVFVNIGMTVHIMPVTGLPLPFLSYGGTSMLLNCTCVAILMNISRQREDLRF